MVAPKLFIKTGTKAQDWKALERERPRIVNNFAARRSGRLRIAPLFSQMNQRRILEPVALLRPKEEYLDADEGARSPTSLP
jgi:hypothetical protein